MRSREAHRPKPPSAIHVAHLVLLRPDQRTHQEQEWLGHLHAQTQTSISCVSWSRTSANSYAHERRARLDTWLAAVAQSHLPVLRSFVKALLKEESALRAGLTLSFSQGQTERQIHKLKLIKCQGYGRAGFPLLRQRMLLAS